MILPNPFLRCKWVPYCSVEEKDLGGLSVLEVSYRNGKPHEAEVSLVRDHPFLESLPEDCPKIVRNLYKKESRLALSKATQALPFSYWEKLYKSWENYVNNNPRVKDD